MEDSWRLTNVAVQFAVFAKLSAAPLARRPGHAREKAYVSELDEDQDRELQHILAELRQAVREASTARAGPAPSTSLGMQEYIEQTHAELNGRATVRMHGLPARVPVVGRLLAWMQEQLGWLNGSKWHTYDVLRQQNAVNSMLVNALRGLAERVAVYEGQLPAHEVEHHGRLGEMDARLLQADLHLRAVEAEHRVRLAEMNTRVLQAESRLRAIEAEAPARLGEMDARLLQTGSQFTTLRDEVVLRLAALERARRLQQPSATPTVATASAVTDDSIDYFGFELKFRGNRNLIRERQRLYLDVFASGGNILDIGCGRGEFVQLMMEHGARVRGIEMNPQMVAFCQSERLPVEQADAITYLQGLEDDSLDGVFCGQVIEHLDVGYLVRLLDVCHVKLRSGAPIVLETPNPLCLTIYARSFYQDPTHVKPVHPATLQFLLEQAGFWETELRFSSPIPESERLSALSSDGSAAPPAWVEAANENVRKLNELLFGCLDYAAVARKFVWPVSRPDTSDPHAGLP